MEKADKRAYTRLLYRSKLQIEPQWIEKAAEKLKNLFPGEDKQNGSYSLKSPFHSYVTINSLDILIKDITSNWDQLKRCELKFGPYHDGVSLTIDLEREIIELSTEMSTNELASERLNDVGKALNLIPVQESWRSFGNSFALSSSFFTRNSLSKDWIENCMVLLTKWTGGLLEFRGTIRYSQIGADIIRIDDQSLWLKKLIGNWNIYNSCEFHFDTEQGRFRFIINLSQASLEVEIESSSESLVKGKLNELEEILGLIPSGPDPYRYRKSYGLYEVRAWSKLKFLEGVEILLERMSEGHSPFLEESYINYISEDKIERLHGFHETNDFLNFLRESEHKIEEIVIRLTSQKGFSVGIYVSADHNRLEIRTTESADKLEEIVFPFQKSLRLKKTKNTGVGAKFDSDPPPPIEKWWIKHIIAIIIALIGALTIIFNAVRAIRTDYEIEISLPGTNNEEVIVDSDRDSITVDWKLRPKDRLVKSDTRNAAATVKLLQNGITVNEWPNVLPGEKIPLVDTGYYRLIIDSKLDAPSAGLTIKKKK